MCSASALFVKVLSRQSLKCIWLGIVIKQSSEISLKKNLYFNTYHHRLRTKPKGNSVIFSHILYILDLFSWRFTRTLCLFSSKRKVFQNCGAGWEMTPLLTSYLTSFYLFCVTFFYEENFECIFSSFFKIYLFNYSNLKTILVLFFRIFD